MKLNFGSLSFKVTENELCLIYKSAIDSGNVLASASAVNSHYVNLWLAGSGSVDLDWGDGTVDTISLNSTLTKYSHQYDGVAATIKVDEPANITQIKSGLSADFTINYSNINNTTTFTSLNYFENTEYGATLAGNPFSELTNVTLVVANPIDPNVGDFNNDFNNDFY